MRTSSEKTIGMDGITYELKAKNHLEFLQFLQAEVSRTEKELQQPYGGTSGESIQETHIERESRK